MSLPAPLPPDLVAIMQRGVSSIVASRDADHRPSIMRAVGSQVDNGARSVTVFVTRSQSHQLLQDIAATGHIAVVFSEPLTHRTVQLKASSASLRNATAADEPVLARYLASMEYELERVRIARPLTRALLAHRIEEVVAITFEPEVAFDATPGPSAGTALKGAGA